MRTKARKYVEAFYDPDLKNWDEMIDQELSRLGLRHGAVTVICKSLNGSMKKSCIGRTRNYQSGQVPGLEVL